MNILLVDDDFFFQKTMSFLLNEAGHQLSLAPNGKKALEMLSQNKDFGMIICDLDMPVLPGELFIPRLKKVYPSGLPVIMVVSAKKDGKKFLEEVKISHDHFFEKPINMDTFRQMLEVIANAEKK